MPRTVAEQENLQDSANRPVRLVAYAWGDKYVDELLSLTLPAALAPNNLPAVLELAPAEVVLLIQRQHYDRVAAHPTIRSMRQLCPVRLVGLDDLIVSKDKYGMTLTYALHRGLRAFGADVTETYFLFLNADFIISDGSLRNALLALIHGERLVASPSYCVVSHTARPELRAFTDRDTGVVAIPPRALARLALKHLHNTVRGKTLNQSDFHLVQMDQFYWSVDKDTLLGHQMPVAIVGMRPERAVDEPNSYWDHGLISEFCPNAKPYLLGDSDDFLMVELREREVAAEQIVTEPLDHRKVAECMIGWVTPYQRAFAELPLTLHAEDLPSGVAAERVNLAAEVAKILSHAPRVFPSHRNHPQWNFHHGAFMEGRHRRLSLELGSITEEQTPPSNLTPVDQAWWRLDGAKKRSARYRVALESVPKGQSATEVFFEEQLAVLPSDQPCVEGGDRTLEAEIAALETCYRKLVRKDVTSAVVPYVRYLRHEAEQQPRPDHLPSGLTTAVRRRLRFLGYEQSLRHARGAIAEAVAGGARDALIVAGDTRIFEELMPTPNGTCVLVSSQGVKSGNLSCVLDSALKFDLCLWELSTEDLLDWRDCVSGVQFCLKPGATVVGFCADYRGAQTPMQNIASGETFSSDIYFDQTSRVIALLRRGRRGLAAHGLFKGAILIAQRILTRLAAQRAIKKHSAVSFQAEVQRGPDGAPLRLAATAIARVHGSGAAWQSGPSSDSVAYVIGSDQEHLRLPRRAGASA